MCGHGNTPTHKDPEGLCWFSLFRKCRGRLGSTPGWEKWDDSEPVDLRGCYLLHLQPASSKEKCATWGAVNLLSVKHPRWMMHKHQGIRGFACARGKQSKVSCTPLHTTCSKTTTLHLLETSVDNVFRPGFQMDQLHWRTSNPIACRSSHALRANSQSAQSSLISEKNRTKGCHNRHARSCSGFCATGARNFVRFGQQQAISKHELFLITSWSYFWQKLHCVGSPHGYNWLTWPSVQNRR